jgi:hypothetical protein
MPKLTLEDKLDGVSMRDKIEGSLSPLRFSDLSPVPKTKRHKLATEKPL